MKTWLAGLAAVALLCWGAQAEQADLTPVVKCGHEERNPQCKKKLEPGLVAHYFKDPENWDGNWPQGAKPAVDAKDWTFREYKYSRVEPLINHLFIRRGWFSVRWVGYLEVPTLKQWKVCLKEAIQEAAQELAEAEKEGGRKAALKREGLGQLKKELEALDLPVDPKAEAALELWTDDGARLWLDDEELVDSWQPTWELDPASHRVVQAKLTPGFHRVVVEYFQGESLKQDDSDPAKFYWSVPELRIKRKIIPASRFFHTEADELDYVPSQGLSPDDLKNLEGGKAPPKKFTGPPAGR